MQEGAAQLVDRVRQKPNALKQWRACEVLVVDEVRSLRYLVITPHKPRYHPVTTPLPSHRLVV